MKRSWLVLLISMSASAFAQGLGENPATPENPPRVPPTHEAPAQPEAKAIMPADKVPTRPAEEALAPVKEDLQQKEKARRSKSGKSRKSGN